jgi:hypothetical protein
LAKGFPLATTDHGHGPVLRVSAETWRAFTHAIRADTALS